MTVPTVIAGSRVLIKRVLSMDKTKVECIDCDGTGLIEGQEWNGEKCRTCHGTGWVDGDDDEEDTSHE